MRFVSINKKSFKIQKYYKTLNKNKTRLSANTKIKSKRVLYAILTTNYYYN